MITGKIKIAVFVIVVLALFLTSCVGNDNSGDILDGLISKDELDSDQYQDDYAFAELYRIVLPESATPELVSAAETLKEKLERTTSTDAEVVYDYEPLSVMEETVDILLGKTNRAESLQSLKGMRDKDYVIEWYGGKLVVGGVGADATLDAITRFCEEILPLSTVAVLMSEEQEISFVGSYELDKIKLCGFELCEYQIIYANGKQATAEKLARDIQARSGYLLDVVDAQKYVGGKYISVGEGGGVTVEADSAVVALKNNCVYLLGSGDKELDAAVESFKEMLFSDKGVVLSDGESETIKFNYPEISFRILNCEIDGSPTISQVNSITSFVDDVDSDIVLLTEVENTLFDRVTFGISSFKHISTPISRNTALPVLYDPTCIKLIGKEEQKVLLGGRLVYGEFKKSTADESFLIINCYIVGVVDLDEIISQIEDIVAEKELPFVIMVSADSYVGGLPDFNESADCVVNRWSRYGYAVYASKDFSASSVDSEVSTTTFGIDYEDCILKKIK